MISSPIAAHKIHCHRMDQPFGHYRQQIVGSYLEVYVCLNYLLAGGHFGHMQICTGEECFENARLVQHQESKYCVILKFFLVHGMVWQTQHFLFGGNFVQNCINLIGGRSSQPDK